MTQSKCGSCKYAKTVPQDITKKICWGMPLQAIAGVFPRRRPHDGSQMKRVLAMVAVWSCLGTCSALAEEKPNYTLLGAAGATSCGSWTESRRDTSKYGFTLTTGYENWILGFLSGANATLTNEHHTDILKNTQLDTLWAWLNNYCESHPLEHISAAVEHLVVELNGKAKTGR